MSESLPTWAQTEIDKALLGAAIRLGATTLVLSDKSICEGFVKAAAAMGDKYERPKGFPEWVVSLDDETLVAKAEALGASERVFTSKENCETFITTKIISLPQQPVWDPVLDLKIKRIQADMEIMKMSIKASSKTMMVTTEAEWIAELQVNNQLMSSNALDRTLCALKKEGWIKSGQFEVALKLGDGEKTTVQPYFSELIKDNLSTYEITLFNESQVTRNYFLQDKPAKIRLISIPDDAHDKVSYWGSRPDFVARPFGRGGSLSITIVADWKGRNSDGDFTDQDIGHILDFLRVLMTHVQPFRIFIYGILSDGVRFQFFKCTRERGQLMYEKSSIYNGIEGYQIFIGLLCAPLHHIGFMEYVIEGVTINEFLGLGGQSMVFSGEYAGKRIVVKVYKREVDCNAELNALKALSDVGHIPKLVVETPVETNCGSPVLLVSPVGIAVQPNRNGVVVNGSHIANLIEVVKTAHSRGIVHCDIKPDNIYFSEECGIFLIDWGSATSISSAINRCGTYGFYNKDRNSSMPISPSDDLGALVKSAYLMLFNLPAPHPQYDREVNTFWKKLFRVGTIWEVATGMCKDCDYGGLKNLFINLK